MREIGVSVYPDFYTVEELKKYLNRAKELGFKKVFVSLILSNQGFENSKKPEEENLRELLKFCKDNALDVSADINDEVFAQFGCSISNLKPLYDMGITKIRLDGGFSIDDIVDISNNEYGIGIEVNSSLCCTQYVNNRILDSIKEGLETIKAKGNIKNITACHNFFPLVGTGLLLEEIVSINNLYSEYEVPVGAFVASQFSPKDLHSLGHGVCTLEKHRYLPPNIAMMEFFAAGIDYVLIGDSIADDSELVDMARCVKDNVIEIPVVFNKYLKEHLKKDILEKVLISRIDQPEKLIRATDTRGLLVEPCYCAPRGKYTVTINNDLSAQYMGEVQISLQNMGSSIEHNVIGFVHPFGEELLQYIKYASNKFKLVEF